MVKTQGPDLLSWQDVSQQLLHAASISMSPAGPSGKRKLYFTTNTETLTFGSVPQTGGYQELPWKNHETTGKLDTLSQNSQEQLPGIWETNKKNAQDCKCSWMQSCWMPTSYWISHFLPFKYPSCPWRRNPARQTAIKFKKIQVPVPNYVKQIFMSGNCGQEC